MSRVIKFRVWNGEQMISPDTIDRHGKARWTENSIPQMTDKVMQFTGLHDKNGKEIYEGDILDGKNRIKKIVEWDSDRCAFVIIEQFKPPIRISFVQMYDKFKSVFVSGGLLTNLEVVGNIHQNPELL